MSDLLQKYKDNLEKVKTLQAAYEKSRMDRIERLTDEYLDKLRQDADKMVAAGKITRQKADDAVKAAERARLTKLADVRQQRALKDAVTRLEKAKEADMEAVFDSVLQKMREQADLDVAAGVMTRAKANSAVEAARKAGEAFLKRQKPQPKCIIGDFPNVRPKGCTTKRGVVLSKRIKPE